MMYKIYLLRMETVIGFHDESMEYENHNEETVTTRH